MASADKQTQEPRQQVGARQRLNERANADQMQSGKSATGQMQSGQPQSGQNADGVSGAQMGGTVQLFTDWASI